MLPVSLNFKGKYAGFQAVAIAFMRGCLILFFCPAWVSADPPEIFLKNGSFEKRNSDGTPADWTLLDHLDSQRYGPPDLKQTFDAIRPLVADSGFRSSQCLAFPFAGTWHCPVFNHSNGDGKGIDGRGTGKAAVFQTVPLPAGKYQFAAWLRTAAGDLYSAGFSLGYNLGRAAPFANDSTTGIHWTANKATQRSFLRGARERGEWARYETETFALADPNSVTVWIRFNYANENQMRARWEVDETAILPVGDPLKDTKSVHQPCEAAKDVWRCREFPGYSEPHLVDAGKSTLEDASKIRLFKKARRIPAGTGVKYRFPQPALNENVNLLMLASGQLEATVGSFSFPLHGQDKLQPAPFEIALPQAVLSGASVEVSVRAIGNESAVVHELELSSPSRSVIRLFHVEADTIAVPWTIGVWDATACEFSGDGQVRDIRANSRFDESAPAPSANDSNDQRRFAATFADLPSTGRWDVHFNHTPIAGHHYYLIHGLIGGRGQIDVGADGLVEWIAESKGEEMVDFEITDLLKPGMNTVRIEATGQHDFAALVETCPGSGKLNRARLSFGGDELAVRLTRVIDNTWFWLRELHYEPSGFIDASVPRGHWFSQYWPIDQAFALREWVRWGHHQESVKTAALVSQGGWHGHTSNRSGSADNTAGNILAIQLVEILQRADGALPSAIQRAIRDRIRSHCNEVAAHFHQSPFGLIRGTNWENAGNRAHGPCYALSTTLGAASALRKAARLEWDPAPSKEADHWLVVANGLTEAVLTNLALTVDHRCPSGFVLPRNTWAYGLRTDGSIEDQPLAGYFWAPGDWIEEAGLVAEDPRLLGIYDRTFKAAMPLFRQSSRHMVSGYAVSYDGPETALVLAALCDRINDFDLLLETTALQTDSVDDIGSVYAELSPWAQGGAKADEDTNLVGAAGFLWAFRVLAGIDDLLADGRQIRLVPRLPWRWNRLTVKDWPVRARDESGRAHWTRLNYELTRQENAAQLRLMTHEPVPKLMVRLGPFPKSGTRFSACLQGKTLTGRQEVSGDATWLWLQTDSGPDEITLTVTCSPSAHPSTER